MLDDDQKRLLTLRIDLFRRAERWQEMAQTANQSAAPELVDALERVLGRLRRWEGSIEASETPHERERLLREGQSLMVTLRRLPLSYETRP